MEATLIQEPALRSTMARATLAVGRYIPSRRERLELVRSVAQVVLGGTGDSQSLYTVTRDALDYRLKHRWLRLLRPETAPAAAATIARTFAYAIAETRTAARRVAL